MIILHIILSITIYICGIIIGVKQYKKFQKLLGRIQANKSKGIKTKADQKKQGLIVGSLFLILFVTMFLQLVLSIIFNLLSEDGGITFSIDN